MTEVKYYTNDISLANKVMLFILFTVLLPYTAIAQLDIVDGWTQFVASDDTRIIYVSADSGDDATAQYYDKYSQQIGSDPFHPSGNIKAFQTIQAAVLHLRNGYPDWILFKKAEVFTNQSFGSTTKFGKNASEPMLIGSYGTSDIRPRILTGNQGFIDLAGTSASYLAIVGLEIEPHSRTGTDEPIGIRIIEAPFTEILIEDCYISKYFTNLTVHDPLFPSATTRKRLIVRRCVIADAYVSNASHANAMFIANVDSILFEENLLDHNGWNDTTPGAQPTGFRHNSYFQVGCTNLVFRENIVARAAATGGGFRCGGTIYNNTFLANPKNIQFGTHESTIDWPSQSVTGDIGWNVVLDSRITGFETGKGITVQKAKNVHIHHNIISDYTPTGDYNLALFLTESENLTAKHNIVHNWANNTTGGPAYSGGLVLGTMLLGQNLIDSNDIQFDNQQGYCVINNSKDNQVVFSNNRYYNILPANNWFEPGGSYAGWLSETNEIGSTDTKVNYTDPGRNISSYMQSLSLSGNMGEFLTLRRKLSKSNWNKDFTAGRLNAYIRVGFGLDGLTNLSDRAAGKNTVANFYNYPNPFDHTTTLSWELYKDSPVKLEIYNNLGIKIMCILDEFQSKGKHSLIFGKTDLPNGIYYCRLSLADHVFIHKMIVIH
ncbi:MAG TPA: T9SS type A sorting domain-containing protein [Saprospiraceae bacterium]|nr:T9SS type A sorting domain-containing protein [Saprospiraceae bacterium]MCC6688238.1 T9SS type A sorting domain-containing protein [Saprospiraceae bacterium]HMX85399.1 T9SS type A sorting domain-containing protein [Saprospiraceae bacterium]HMZ73390.1 T9SS type A sorting domain-containing protein [Saprospiraceae bacterium]HNA94745.1 T9SS type A sorting domain-containing protein [Saprospiraceae bacterium]